MHAHMPNYVKYSIFGLCMGGLHYTAYMYMHIMPVSTLVITYHHMILEAMM